MRNTGRRSLCLLLALLLCLSLLPSATAQTAQSNETSGKCGDNLTWTLDDEGTLTISGTGEMWGVEFDSEGDDEYRGENLRYYEMPGEDVHNVMILDGVTSIGISAFCFCDHLQKITVPASVTMVGGWVEHTYYEDLGIDEAEEIIAHTDIEYWDPFASTEFIKSAGPVGGGFNYEFGWYDKIPTHAFHNCRSLESIVIPSGVREIGDYAFSGCTALKTVSYDGDIPKWDTIKIGQGNDALLHAVMGDKQGKCGDDLTWRLDEKGKLTISGTGAMWNYDNDHKSPWGTAIKTVEIENGATSIGDCAFYDCGSLTNITIPEGVTSIGVRAFCNCDSLTSITIPEGVTSIGERAFDNCGSLTRVNIPTSMKSIRYWAFYGCDALTGVFITDMTAWCGIEFDHYHSNPLEYAHKLYLNGKLVTDAVIPDGVTSIGNDAFSGCSSLTSLEISSSVTNIGNYAFFGCGALKSLEIPPSVTNIGNYAFSDCDSLTSVTLPAGLTEISSFAFTGCSALKSVVITEGVIKICCAAFFGCTSLASVTIPASMKTIEGEFYRRYGDEIVEEDSDPAAFANCSALTDVYYAGTQAQWRAVKIGKEGNEYLLNATVHCTDDKPEVPSVTGKLASGKPKLTWKAVEGAAKYEIWRSTSGEKGSFKRIATVTGTSWTNAKAGAGKTFYYKVKAVSEAGKKSAFSEIVKLTARPKAPEATGSLSAKAKPILTWKTVTGAAKYEIWRSTTGEKGSFKRVKTTTALTYTHTKATDGQTYYYKLKAVTADGTKSVFSSIVKLTAGKSAKPAAPKPTGKLSSGKPKLTWKAVTGAEKYEIWRSTTGKSGSFKKLATVTGTSWTNKKAGAGKTYYYKVKAVTADGKKSDFSKIVKLTARPKAPTVAGKLSAKGKPVLTWKAVTGATEYQIWRSTSKNGTYKLIKTTTALKYTNSKAASGKTFYYKVKAVTADGTKSLYSSVVKLTVK